MTDSLRTRIAAALLQHDCFKGHCTCGQSYGGDTFTDKDAALHLADAVIRELQLTVLGGGIVVGVIVGESHA